MTKIFLPARICRSHPDILNCCICQNLFPQCSQAQTPERPGLHSMYIPNKAAVRFLRPDSLFRRRIQLNHIRLPRGISHHRSNVFSEHRYTKSKCGFEIGYEFTDEVYLPILSAASCCIFTFCILTLALQLYTSYCFLFPAYVLLHQIYSSKYICGSFA